MSTFLLVHGAWHGAWCWYKVIPLLEQHGHTVIAPDLPSHGRDRTDPSRVTLSSYTDCIAAILDARSEPVILVGHSMGGIVITQTAEYRPEKIKTLAYVTGFLLKNGQTLLDIAQADATAQVLPNLEFSPDQKLGSVRPTALRNVFYNDCSEEDFALARAALVPQPLAPFATPMATTPERFGRVARVYLECLRDNAISPSAQKTMYAASPCNRIIPLDRSHSPFLSAPVELATHLLSLA